MLVPNPTPALPHTHPPQDMHALLLRMLYYVSREPLFFPVRDGPAFAELDYVVCFPDDILIRGLSHTQDADQRWGKACVLSAEGNGCSPAGSMAHPGTAVRGDTTPECRRNRHAERK